MTDQDQVMHTEEAMVAQEETKPVPVTKNRRITNKDLTDVTILPINSLDWQT